MGFGGPGIPINLYRGVLSAPAGSGLSSAPGNGATVTIWDSTLTDGPRGTAGFIAPPLRPCRLQRFQLTILSSHDSGPLGVVVEESDDGTQWDPQNTSVFPATYTAASGRMTYDVVRTAAQSRFKYTNSGNPLTKWQASLDGLTDRAKAV